VSRTPVLTLGAAVAALVFAGIGAAQAQQYKLPTAKPAGCAQRGILIEGTSGNDTRNGRGVGEVIIGFGGNDTLNGRGGTDCLYGNAGRDRLYGGADRDAIYGGAGRDTGSGGSGNVPRIPPPR